MSTLLELELLGLPPTLNQMYRNRGHYRYKTGAVQAYQRYATMKLRDEWGNRPAYTGAVSLSVKLMTKDKRRWDIDNRVKALQDCLSIGGVIEDDSQIDELHVKRERREKTATYIALKSLDDKL